MDRQSLVDYRFGDEAQSTRIEFLINKTCRISRTGPQTPVHRARALSIRSRYFASGFNLDLI